MVKGTGMKWVFEKKISNNEWEEAYIEFTTSRKQPFKVTIIAYRSDIPGNEMSKIKSQYYVKTPTKTMIALQKKGFDMMSRPG